MHLLFLSWRDIKSKKAGGAEVFTHEMLKRLPQDQFQITHFSVKEDHLDSEEIIDGVKYIRKGGLFSVIKEAKKFYLSNKDNIDYVVDQCNTHRFFTPFYVEKEKRLFFIHQLTKEIWFKHMKFPFSLVGYLTENAMLKIYKNDYSFTVSNSTKNDLLDLKFKDNKVFILPEGIDFKHWDKKDFLEKEEAPTFIYVGRYAKYKGIDDSLKAFCEVKKEFKNAKFWILGKKNEEYLKNNLLPILDQNNISYGDKGEDKDVTIFGFVSEEEKLNLMSKAHVLLFPSLREGWGLIITEAAAVGTYSIVYNSQGTRDAVDNGNAGCMCQNNTVDEIVSYMTRSLKDEEFFAQMREQAYNFSLNFHWDNTATSFIECMNKINNN
ncbi:glycosyltransferase family 4 protein [Peptostreptococcaceae bacterium AGR-M142]